MSDGSGEIYDKGAVLAAGSMDPCRARRRPPPLRSWHTSRWALSNEASPCTGNEWVDNQNRGRPDLEEGPTTCQRSCLRASSSARDQDIRCRSLAARRCERCGCSRQQTWFWLHGGTPWR